MDQLMMDGLALDEETDIVPPEEREAFDIISAPLKKMLAAEGIHPESLGISNKPGKEKKSTYSNIFFYREVYPICRIRIRKKDKYIRIRKKYKDEAKKYTSVKESGSDNYVRIEFESFDDLKTYEPLFRFILEDLLDSMPSDFGCCARYEQCSNAGKCMNESGAGVECSYRKKLRKGIIFYGKNRIDLSTYAPT